jgi:hypothetical protein
VEINAIQKEKLGEHSPSYKKKKNWVAQFKRGDFSTFLFRGRAKDLSAPRVLVCFVCLFVW